MGCLSGVIGGLERKAVRNKRGVTRVVTNTIATIAEKISLFSQPTVKPTLATINPTSPRETMPIPSWRASRRENPANNAPPPAPTIFPRMAISHNQ